MTRTKLIILMAFVLALGAGVAVGMLGSRTIPTQPAGGARLIEDLKLDPQQKQQMDQIWTDLMRSKGREYADEFSRLRQEKETALASLLTAEQKLRYEELNQQFARREQEIWKRGEQDFEAAIEKTRSLLGEAQQQKFEQMIARFRSHRDQMQKFGASMGAGPATAPAGTN